MDKTAVKMILSEESANILADFLPILSHYQRLSVEKDTEMLTMIDTLDETRLGWKEERAEKEKMAEKYASVERENTHLVAEIEDVRELLRKSEEKAAALQANRQASEAEIREYKKRLETVRNIVKENCGSFGQMSKLMPLLSDESSAEGSFSTPPSSHSNNSSSQCNNAGIDYDRTEDSFGEQPAALEKVHLRGGRAYIRRSGQPVGKRSASHQPPKKRSIAKAQLANIDEMEVRDIDEEECATPPKRSRDAKREMKVRIDSAPRKVFRRSASESSVLQENKQQLMTPRAIATSRVDIRSPMVGFGSTWTKGRPIEECEHKFTSANAFFMSTCCVCSRSLGLRALKCEDCKMFVHENCKIQAPIPCLLLVNVPQKQKQRPRLVEYCPDTPPKIPALLIRCVIALEGRHLNTVGLYRIQGREGDVKALVEGLSSTYRDSYKLDSRDAEIITGCIKKFLIGLREPLIPTSSYTEFVKAAESGDEELLANAVTELPVPNRDTLAYLCAHWQKVASNHNVNQMPIENLAKCLGPTVVGGSLPKDAKLVDQKTEVERQIRVLFALLRLDSQFWTSFYNSSVVSDVTRTPRTHYGKITTPKTAPPISNRIREFNADKSLLGPVTKSPSKGVLLQPLTRTPARPNFKRMPPV